MTTHTEEEGEERESNKAGDLFGAVSPPSHMVPVGSGRRPRVIFFTTDGPVVHPSTSFHFHTKASGLLERLDRPTLSTALEEQENPRRHYFDVIWKGNRNDLFTLKCSNPS